MVLKALLFVSFLILTSLFADTSLTDAEFRGEAKAKITFLEKQNAELKTKLDSLEDKQKSVEEYKDILNQQNSRISDISLYITSFGILIAIMTIGATIFGYFSVKSHAKEEARASAQAEINELKIEFDKIVKNAKEELEKIAEIHSDYVKQKELMKGKDIKEYSETNGDKEGLNGALQYALYKAQTYQDYNSWFDVAMFALKLKDRKAIEYWENAISVATNDLSKSVAIMNKGATFGQLTEYQKAIETYDDFLRRFSETENENIQEQIGNALLNKGLVQVRLNEQQKAIETYDNFLEKFSDTQNIKMQEQSAMALLSKGFAQGQLVQNQKAIETYEELVRRFGNSQNQKIKESIAQALLNLFELQVIENKIFNTDMIVKFQEYAKNNQQSLLKFKMIQIMKNALTEAQTDMINKLKQEFSDTSFGSWGWKELDTWADKLQDIEAKERVQKTIEIFRNWDKEE